MRLAFTLEYDGTNFSGFQRQINATTIQEHIENAIKKVVGSDISINYSGRTDAGVHALSQVFDFETDILNLFVFTLFNFFLFLNFLFILLLIFFIISFYLLF